MSSHIVLLSGSNRSDSQSVKVANYLRDRLERLELCESINLIDLASSRLPPWPEKDTDNVWSKQQSILKKATALVVISPEWNGMACPALKNFFLYAGLAELGHKPALLVGVSAGLGGAYPIAELRGSSYKNCRITYLPEQLIVRQVESMLNNGEPQDENDIRLRARADWALHMLCCYDKTLQTVRNDIDMYQPDFSNGM
ncbi:NAD(P)H-dependent oxidoreductase [Pseudomonas sp. RTC3]|uniref:NADPH-dependent FMN reductase n=1 Tax=unclassified Pseudomonas TaxID=196821 RepID=UPI002AB46BDD|nr:MULTISPECIES: NAD(P)H-dependent oxidoreductase [unclassified Pseudomonas]MEB0062939.1 NAD(P)H-dependent oxidoreductase [Pseudomonas sp. RTC3]MDY7564287.1 NAD(P)H-dependent oxidoreductase [Pseudomonas sp. 5C2]MEB0007990.1 NAD(P)H-dependent oxidoreductase [Pseudomonas sp. RTB2]MEB0017404.1 NAD(P)H-dependent oxidoreductase [Pseudomonas sp. RTB3]MEB0028173.1 NAD(P)H-dependent oxidoreductase [Pseudomonas sp. MH9.2]